MTAARPTIEDWILRSFEHPSLGRTMFEFHGIIERAERDGRRGLAVLSQPEGEGEEPRFRHILSWVRDDSMPILFARMLNPSTARALSDDQTMKKLIGFAKQNGYGGVVVINECDFRATKPAAAKAAGWPTTGYNGTLGNRVLNDLEPHELRRDVLLAWGDHGPPLAGWATGRRRDPRVRFLTLGITNRGRPEHPCMLPYSRELKEFIEQ